MRAWIGWGCLTVIVSGGVAFVAAGGSHSHCGPCVGRPEVVVPTDRPVPPASSSDVTDVVDFAEVLVEPPPEPRRLPVVNFDAPGTPAAFAGVVTVGYSAAGVEIAPPPRAVVPAVIPLAADDSPF